MQTRAMGPRSLGAVGGLAGLLATAVLLYILFWQWRADLGIPRSTIVTQVGPDGQVLGMQTQAEYLAQNALRQGLVLGGGLLASLTALLAAWRAGPRSARREAFAMAAAALILLVIGLIGWFGVSAVIFYLPAGLLVLASALWWLRG